MNKNLLLAIFILSVITLFLLNYDNGFSFIISHTYEIGSVSKPRQMHWKTPNWDMIIPFVATISSFVYFMVLRKKN
jgi:hypothetical protein|tara:strand:- start:604 stop:831 length:228 start_codon:yes stop_codon:yes gene_type:complete